MKLRPPSKQPMRVHELAKELSWPSSQLVAELRRRGEYVKSPMSTVEAPVVRDIRRDFATVADAPNPDATLAPAMYGSSAERETEVDPDGTFAVALAEARSKARQKGPGSRPPMWPPAILQAILDEGIVPRRLEHLDEPRSGYFRWEVKQAEELNGQWAEARLNGLSGDDATVIKWIRLSDGQRPEIAADLSRGGIAPEEAGLHIGYGGRTGARWSSIYERYRDRRLSLSEVIVAVRQWHAAG